IERSEASDFINASHSVECVEVTRVTRREPGCFEITRPQIPITKRGRALSLEKMESQPTPICARDALRLAKEGDEKKKDEISIDLSLELEVACEIFRINRARAALELKRGMERMIDLFDERNQRTDVAIAQASPRIVLLKLFDQPARI